MEATYLYDAKDDFFWGQLLEPDYTVFKESKSAYSGTI